MDNITDSEARAEIRRKSNPAALFACERIISELFSDHGCSLSCIERDLRIFLKWMYSTWEERTSLTKTK